MLFASQLVEDGGRYMFLGGGSGDAEESVGGAVVIDGWDGELDELGVAVAKICLVVIGARACGMAASGAGPLTGELIFLSRPAAFRALDTIAYAFEEFFERDFESDRSIECEAVP